MAAEDMEKSATPIVDTSNINNGDVDDELEEGEIVGDEASAAAISPRVSAADETHPLEHSWTFWFDNPTGKAKQSTWGNSIRAVYTFSTIEQFWSIYNNIRHPSKLGLRTDLYCFKHKIEPKWEDPVCANGGKWTVCFPKGRSDTPFLYTLLAMIGEQFDHGGEVCGAVVNIRQKEDRISVWTKNALNESAQVSIGRQWKEFLDYKETMGFIVHVDAKAMERNAKNRYSL